MLARRGKTKISDSISPNENFEYGYPLNVGPRSDCSICVTQPSAEFVFLKNQKDYKILL